MTASVQVEFRNATLGYGRRVILSDISFAIHGGEYFGLVGPNGAGKTTIVRTILGTIRPLGGEVMIHRANGEAPRLGYVPQRDSIDYIMPYTVGEVVMMGRYRYVGSLRRPSGRDREIVARCLTHVEMDGHHDHVFKELSGGQKQRVLIARALASEPSILILDEPTNGMDLSSKHSILGLINTLHREDRLTIVMVSHLLDDVANHVERIAVVDRDVFMVGPVASVLTAANLSNLYQLDVRVGTLEGNTVIYARDHRGTN